MGTVRDFFADQTIFITGGTGFLGKVLVEKLLRVCNPQRIYLLVRPKKGKSTDERFADYFSYACFDSVKNRRDLADRIAFVNGDCEESGLGMGQQCEEMLRKEVTVVIHAAANVKFDQTLRVAANINVRATMDVLALARTMERLKVFVHVSTAFSNCPQKNIEECFYQTPMSAEQLMTVVDGLDDSVLNNITSKLIGKWPNTYVFTKAIAEDHVKSAKLNVPVVVFRPSIVTSTIAEPVPGWIDNFYGVVGIVAGAALGALRSLNAKLSNPAYVVPCDYVANAVLAATASNVTEERASDPMVYNYVGSKKNLPTWKSFIQRIEDCAWDYPTEKMVWYYTFKIRENTLWHKICVFFLHTVAAYLADFVLLCCGRAPIAVRNYDRLDKLLSLTSYFTMNRWHFATDNMEGLWEGMGEEDRKLFEFNMDHTDWGTYARASVIGGRIYLLKDPLDTVPQGRRKLMVLRVAHYGIIALLLGLLFMLVKWISSSIF